MNHEPTSSKQSFSKKKKILITWCIVLGSLLLLYLFTLLLENTTTSDKNNNVHSNDSPRIDLWEADFEENIFLDDVYMQLDRDIHYKNGNITYTIPLDKYENYEAEIAFWGDYFHTVIHGESEQLNHFYTNDYLAQNGKFENFTMQKIYDIAIERRTVSEIEKDGKRFTQIFYLVEYKIYHNNGTFRNDIPPDSVVPLFFEVLHTETDIKINSVSKPIIRS